MAICRAWSPRRNPTGQWSENPTVQDARHLLTFLAEHPKPAKHGYIVCRCSRPARIHDRITALPWFCL
jgi:hypothetical protein